MVDGDHHIERDDEGLAYDDLKLSAAAAKSGIYHDGIHAVRTIRHDGKVLAIEHSGDHEA